MKKILYFTVALMICSVAVSAQSRTGDRVLHHQSARGFQQGDISRGERAKLRADDLRYHHARRQALRDGKITPAERRRVHALKAKTRRDAFRFKHNRRHRII